MLTRKLLAIAGRAGLAASLAVGAAAATEPAADRARALEFTGACYCREAGELRCVAGLTEQECTRRCAEDLCDDWFWLERRACWNWGYGG
jgi:hypothetical protein